MLMMMLDHTRTEKGERATQDMRTLYTKICSQTRCRLTSCAAKRGGAPWRTGAGHAKFPRQASPSSFARALIAWAQTANFHAPRSPTVDMPKRASAASCFSLRPCIAEGGSFRISRNDVPTN